MRFNFTGIFILLVVFAKAQLLSWTPEFVADNGTIEITMDATLGNQGLVGHNATDVYVHTGVITNLSTNPSDWKYVKFNQNFNAPNPSLQATAVPGQPNKWRFTVTNIREFYGVPQGEVIQKISILFRSGNGTRVQRNSDGSDMYIPLDTNPAEVKVRLTSPFKEPRFTPVVAGLCTTVGSQLAIEAKSSQTAQLRILYNGQQLNSLSGTSITANVNISSAGLQRIIAEASIAGATPTFTFNGNGAWTTPSNWAGGVVPPATIPAGTEVIINPAAGGACLLNVSESPVTFSAGSKLTVADGASFNINGNFNYPSESAFTGGQLVVRDTIEFFIAAPTPVAALPEGVDINGVTYHNGGTSATLVLYAPNKNNVVVVGDFNDWKPNLTYQLNRTPDNLRYWVRVDGLTPGQEYAYQYVIDCNLKLADYNAEKILDPWNDAQIPATTYPNLKPYPMGKTTDIVSVLQPGKPQYNWVNNSFQRPDKRNMVAYELLVRDYAAEKNFQAVINNLPELASLGINTLKLMPFTEFENNNSWGYNPSFMYAVDKAYGTENKLRELIDSCHGRGIAVVLDMVLNHQFGQSPMVRMYYDAVANKPAANSPWFNQDATHPFNVGFDMNHEAPATIEFVERVMDHWLTKFRLDGFRWDLSKGFTQRNTPSDVGAWNAYDQSRVNIWDRIYNQSQAIAPGCYMILEHLGNDDEEAELAKKGMILWGKMTSEFNESTMGTQGNSNFGRAYHTTRWSAFGGNQVPLLMAYAESHDEERLMHRNRRFGGEIFPQGQPPYSTKDVPEAARRMQAMAAFLFTIPGPKMMWQFGEYGYDASINMCENFTTPPNDGCRTSPKPLVTNMPSPFFSATLPGAGFTFSNYKNVVARNALKEMYAKIIRLRTKNNDYLSTFTTNDVEFSLGGLAKWQKISSNNLRIMVVGNFGLTNTTINVNFQTTGLWQVYAHNIAGSNFSAINGNLTTTTMNVTTTNQGFSLAPGNFLLFIDRPAVLAFNVNAFDASNTAGNMALQWSVDSEQNIASYEVERSIDGLNFDVIATKAAGNVHAGKNEVVTRYNDLDKNMVYSDKPVYYRVRINDKQGEYLYTGTKVVMPKNITGRP